jgi:hypothetical protein
MIISRRHLDGNHLLELHSKGACLHSQHYLLRKCCISIIWNIRSSWRNDDTDGATKVKLAEGHLLQMYEAELKKKSTRFAKKRVFTYVSY